MQVLSGAFDTLSHAMETYLGNSDEDNVSDDVALAIMRNTVVNMARYVHFDVIDLRRSRKQIQLISSENIENCLVRFKSISLREHIHYFRKPA